MTQERTFWSQMKAMIIRNALIKCRKRKETVMELIMPLYFIGILVLVRTFLPSPHYPAVNNRREEVDLFTYFETLHNFTVGVAPESHHVKRFLAEVNKLWIKTGNADPIHFMLFETESDLVQNYRKKPRLFQLGLVFADDNPFNDGLKYDLLTNPSSGLKWPDPQELYGDVSACRPLTDECHDLHCSPVGWSEVTDCPVDAYYKSGFAALQMLVDLTKIQVSFPDETVEVPEVPLSSLPKEAYTQDSLNKFRAFIPGYMVIAVSQFINLLLLLIVGEKEKKIKEGMKSVGLRDSVYWLSWLIVYIVFVLIIALVSTFMLCYMEVFRYTPWELVFILTFFYGASIIVASFMITPFFDKAKVTISLVPQEFMTYNNAICHAKETSCRSPSLVPQEFETYNNAICNAKETTCRSANIIVWSTTVRLFWISIHILCTKVRTAGMVGSLFINFVSFLYIFIAYLKLGEGNHTASQWLLSLVSPIAYALAASKMVDAELSGGGVSWGGLWSGPGFSVGASLIMLAVDILLYSVLTFYLDSVWPSEYGTKRHPLFFLNFQNPSGNSILAKHTSYYKMDNVGGEDVEEVAMDVGKCEAIRIVGLCKTFSVCNRPPVNALKGIDLVVYENEITAVLGQNGAGKSTLFNILTGLTPPSAGTALLYGRDIRNPKSMSEIQRMTGVCPQTDILFEDLTAREHLTFFARIKGVEEGLLISKVEKALQEVALEDEADSPSLTLSGGQKRKLSIAIAIIGDPKIVIFDEPTAGVDAYSKRHIWSLLEKIKPSKVVLLTTHFMEEADIVADRKAIICNGRLRCSGTSLFLKNRFGIGSRLMLELKDEMPPKSNDVIRIIKSYEPTAYFSHNFGKEIYFILPNESLERLAPLLFFIETEIKSTDKSLGILSYSLCMSSLEQVFLHLTTETELNEGEESTTQEDVSPITRGPEQLFSTMDIHYEPSFGQMAAAVLRLRLLRLFREWHQLIFMVVFPLMIIGFGLYMNKGNIKQDRCGTLHLSPELYPSRLAVHRDPGGGRTDFLSYLDPKMKILDYNGTPESLLALKPLLAALPLLSPYSTSIAIAYNDTMQHSLPVVINQLTNAMLKKTINSESHKDGNRSITASIRQLPLTSRPVKQNIEAAFSLYLMGMFFTLIPISLCFDVIQDRESKAKHLLHVSGLPRSVYFSVYILVLGGLMLLISLPLLVLMSLLGLASLASPPALFTAVLLIFTYCPAAILFVICLSYLFDKAQTAMSVLHLIALFLGTVPFFIFVALDSFEKGSMFHVIMSLTNILYVPYSVFYQLHLVHTIFVTPSFTDHFSPQILVLLCGSLLQIPLWSFVLSILDSNKSIVHFFNLWYNRKVNPNTTVENTSSIRKGFESSDVEAERDKVFRLINEDKESTPVFMAQDLCKEYAVTKDRLSCRHSESAEEKKQALSGLTFALDRGEVFGLLGHNGAGKTSTIKIITGEEQPTSGQVWVKGSRDDVVEAGLLGYCPQQDTLWTNITVREHLEIYASIRGVRPPQLNRLVESCLTGMLMAEHGHKRVQTCSGGTRRKLSFAVSALGPFSLALLDEPSTGMDARAKRSLWNTIRNTYQGNRGAILTSHSMEEAEALCSRVGIMRSGAFRCIGTTQYLKNKYGGGYVLEVKLQPTADRSQVLAQILFKFPASVVSTNVMDRLVFGVPQEAVKSVAEVFFFIEKVKAEIGILMYSFNQTNLEHVFLSLTAPDDETNDSPAP